MTDVTINGRSRATAEALLSAAERIGVDVHTIRATTQGYIVPAEVSSEYQRMVRGETDPIEDVHDGEDEDEGFPAESWKNDEIKAWADSHGVDLGGATKKADMLAAIQAADTKEE